MCLHLRRWLFRWPVFVALQVGLCAFSQAAPQLDLRLQNREQLSTDIRSVWQTAIVHGETTTAVQPLGASTVWSWADSQFEAGQAKPLTVKQGERLVGRWSMLLGDNPRSLFLELPVPRLDLVHLSYRHNSDAWIQVSAGDQVPMVKWPFASRYPVFVIPAKKGELQVVLDVPVPGLFSSPVFLRGELAFLEEQSVRNTEMGAVLALSLVSMMVCIGAAAVFRRFAFIAVGLYSVSIFLVSAGQGGIFGMYLGTTTTWFNDYVKYITATIFGAMVPWTLSLVVTQKYYSKFTAHAASGWAAGSMVVMVVMLFTVARATQWALLSPFIIASLTFGSGIALASVLRRQPHGWLALAAMTALTAGSFAPIASYWGYLDGTFSFSVSTVCFYLSNTFLLMALFLQYRRGNRVLVRTQGLRGRDALTGLLNRRVFEHRLHKFVLNADESTANALFLYISMGNREALEAYFGGEGFESGMVQTAAALSSSISIVDTVARLSSNTFGVLAVMPPDTAQGNALAQKIIARVIAVASHSAPAAQTARIALAWVPAHGQELSELERSAKAALEDLSDGKRMSWVSRTPTKGNSASPSGGSKKLVEAKAEV